MPNYGHQSYFADSTADVALPGAVICGGVVNTGAADATIYWGGGAQIKIPAGASFNLPFIPGHSYLNFGWTATGTQLYVALTVAKTS